MAKTMKGPAAPQAAKSVLSLEIATLDGVHSVSVPVPTAADLQALTDAAVKAAETFNTADRTAAGAAWKAAETFAPLYAARRASGEDDLTAHRAILSTLKKAGVNEKTCTPLAKAARGLAAGIERKPGETYKVYADRIGTPVKQGGGEKPKADTAANRAKAMAKAVTCLGDALAALRSGKASKALIDATEKVATAAAKEAEAEKAAAEAEKNAKA